MKHYYIVVYQSKVNDRIFQRIVHISRYALIRWFDKETDKLLSFVKISKKKKKKKKKKKEAKYLGYKFD